MMPGVENFSAFLDWRTLLIENYKSLGLDESDLAIILIIDRCKSSGQPLVTPELITLKHTMSCDEIDSRMESLMNRKIIAIRDCKDGLETSLQPLIDKMIANMVNEQARAVNKINDEIYTLLEKSFSRPLTPFEVSVVRSWFDNGEKIEKIKEAINVAIFSNKKNINYIDSVLLEWKRRNDIADEGQSTVTSKWRKNLGETIELAKLNWLED